MSRVARGFSLLEVLVALIILELCLMGIAGLLALAARRLTEAQLRERATAVAGTLADSISLAGGEESGESIRGDWRVGWQAEEGGGLVLRVSLLDDIRRQPVVELRLP